jgi:hypothetical protein
VCTHFEEHKIGKLKIKKSPCSNYILVNRFLVLLITCITLWVVHFCIVRATLDKGPRFQAILLMESFKLVSRSLK